MNDYWNDPPEFEEAPECCGEMMELGKETDFVCSVCGKTLYETPDEPDPAAWEDVQPWEGLEYDSEMCRHGNEWNARNACAYESDIAYDAMRERRSR